MHNFSYDADKADANLRKHGVSFAEAEGVFADPLAITVADPDASQEERFIAMGQGNSGALLVVVFTERKEQIRLISARPASRKERKDYER